MTTVPIDEIGDTVLHFAAWIGDLETCKSRIEYAREKNDDGDMPIHLAATNGQLEICKLFLKHDPSLKLEKGESGWTPLHCAVGRGHLPVCELLVDTKTEKNDPGNTALAVARMREALSYNTDEKKELAEIIKLLSRDENGKDDLQAEIAKLQNGLDKVKSLLANKK